MSGALELFHLINSTTHPFLPSREGAPPPTTAHALEPACPRSPRKRGRLEGLDPKQRHLGYLRFEKRSAGSRGEPYMEIVSCGVVDIQ